MGLKPNQILKSNKQMTGKYNKLHDYMIDLGYSEQDFENMKTRLSELYSGYGLDNFLYTDKGNSEYTVYGEDPFRVGKNLLYYDENNSWDQSKPLARMLEYLEQFGSTPLTLDQLTSSVGKGMKVVQDKNTGQWKTIFYGPDGPSDEDKRTIYWNQDPLTGTFTRGDVNTHAYSAPKQDNTFSNLMTVASLAMGGYGLYNLLTAPAAASMAAEAYALAATEGLTAAEIGTLMGTSAAEASTLIGQGAIAAGGTAAGTGAGMDLWDLSWDTADWSLPDSYFDSSGFAMDQGIAEAMAEAGIDPTAIANQAYEAAKAAGWSGFGEIPSSILSSLPSYLKQGLSSLSKILGGSGTGGDALGLLSKLFGGAQLGNSVSDTVGDWLDEIRVASPFTRAETDALGDRAIELAGRDYLAPEFENLMGQYEYRGAQADRFGGLLEQLYSNPLDMDVFQALSQNARNDTLRAQGARGNLNAGNLESDMMGANVKAMLGLAQPMNQSWQTALSGQQVPIQMIGALNNADNSAWTGAANVGRIAQGDQQALANYITQIAAPAELTADPTRMGIESLFGTQGTNKAKHNTSTSLSSLWS